MKTDPGSRRFPRSSSASQTFPTSQALPFDQEEPFRESPARQALDIESLFTRLLLLEENLLERSAGGVEFFVHEVAHLTQGRVSIILHRPSPARTSTKPLLPWVPIETGERFYGVLLLKVDPARPSQPFMSLSSATLLANFCALLFSHLETQALMAGLYQPELVRTLLTPREQEVLELLCQGNEEQDIADSLHIALKTVKKHRENLYRKLRVRNAQQLRLAAFTNGLYTPVASLTPHIGDPFEER